ncbi:hypothetical protein AURDEDRAFT_115899 [Auricularia subglabra TFB-10046 SS5]|nr:hypothetical protein AURDEDRAFT_115899 [Auricularia subglabra TFB-10046 SS5]
MALSLLLVPVVLLCALSLAHRPQCAAWCSSATPSEYLGNSGDLLPCPTDRALAALSSCADSRCAPEERGDVNDVLRRLCHTEQQGRLDLIQRAAMTSRSNLDPTKRDDDDNDDDDDDDDGDSHSPRRSHVGAAVGGTLGGVAAVALLAILYVHHRRRRQRRPRQPKKHRRAEIGPEEDPHNQFRPPQIVQPSSGNYDPLAQHERDTAPPLVPPKDDVADPGGDSPPVYDHSGAGRAPKVS